MKSDGIRAHHHAVQFYGSDQSLFSTVAAFLAEGLVSGEPAIVMATQPHRAGIEAELAARLIDVERARQTGDLVMLDAHEMLEFFVVEASPDRDLFEQHIGGLIVQTLKGRKRTNVRAYGEMVDILWKAGHMEAALELEFLWNRLAAKHDFALLCGYAMGSFYKRIDQFERVCSEHTHTLAGDSHLLNLSAIRSRSVG